MKRILFTLVCVLALSVMSLAQTKVYAEIVGNEYSGLTVSVEFGKNSKRFAYMLKDENGKKVHFNTMIDAMNQLAKFGWELESTYVVVDGDYDRVSTEYHWIVSREEEIGEEIIKDE